MRLPKACHTKAADSQAPEVREFHEAVYDYVGFRPKLL